MQMNRVLLVIILVILVLFGLYVFLQNLSTVSLKHSALIEELDMDNKLLKDYKDSLALLQSLMAPVQSESARKGFKKIDEYLADYELNKTLLMACQDSLAQLKSDLASAHYELAKNQSKKPYMYGIPSAPPFRKAEAFVKNAFDDCTQLVEKAGYIIKYQPDTMYGLLIQFEDGSRENVDLDKDGMSNAAKSYLPSILIPGNKVSLKLECCGSGNYLNVLYIRNLPRM